MIKFYIHTPIDDLNERRALVRMGRLLKQLLDSRAETYYLVANISPDGIAAWKDRILPQLDAMLIGPDGVSLIEIKACPDPFDGSDLKGPWRLIQRGKQLGRPLYSGNSVNPYQQARFARYQWMNELLAPSTSIIEDPNRSKPLTWGQLSGCILFAPYLNQKARVPHLGRDDRWLTITGLDRVTDFVFAARSNLKLSRAERERLVIDVLQAKEWVGLNEVIDQRLGYLHYETDKGGQTSVVDVLRHDEITIGRSRDNNIQIPDNKEFRHVSRKHIRIESGRDSVRLIELGARHSTIVSGKKIPSGESILLHGGEEILIGGRADGNCRLVFTHLSYFPDVGESTSITS
ncbi:MAG: FHA domain-containing protein, partial [Chloroflexota bacterium]